MPNKESAQVASGVTAEDLLLALVTLEVDRRESNQVEGQIKTELLLSNAGLGAQQIAQIMGKNAAAVRMMISRSKPKKAVKTAVKEDA